MEKIMSITYFAFILFVSALLTLIRSKGLWNDFLMQFFVKNLTAMSRICVTLIESILYSFFIFGIEVRAIFSYTYINYAAHLMISNYVSKIDDDVKLTITRMRSMRKLFETHFSIIEDINSLFGIIPFMSIALFFNHTCFHVSIHFIEVAEPARKVAFWMVFLTIASVNLVMMLTLGLITPDRDYYLKIMNWVYKHESLHQDSFLNQEKVLFINFISHLNVNSAQHNAWNMFFINRRFILAFLGSLIPSCVMITQSFQSN
jgi:hypothetical protein